MGCFKSKPKTPEACPAKKSRKVYSYKEKHDRESYLARQAAFAEARQSTRRDSLQRPSGAFHSLFQQRKEGITAGSMRLSDARGPLRSRSPQRKESMAENKVEILNSLSQQKKDSSSASSSISAATARKSEKLASISGQTNDGLTYSATGTASSSVKNKGDNLVETDGTVIVEGSKKGICCAQVPGEEDRTAINTHGDTEETFAEAQPEAEPNRQSTSQSMMSEKERTSEMQESQYASGMSTRDGRSTTGGGTPSIRSERNSIDRMNTREEGIPESRSGMNPRDGSNTKEEGAPESRSGSNIRYGSNNKEEEVPESRSGSDSRDGSNNKEEEVPESRSGRNTRSGSNNKDEEVPESRSGRITRSGSIIKEDGSLKMQGTPKMKEARSQL